VRRLAWLTNLPQEKEQISEEAEGPSMDDGLPAEMEVPVEVMPAPAAPLNVDHPPLAKTDPAPTEARRRILTQVKRPSHVKRLEQSSERIKQLTEIRRQRIGVSGSFPPPI